MSGGYPTLNLFVEGRLKDPICMKPQVLATAVTAAALLGASAFAAPAAAASSYDPAFYALYSPADPPDRKSVV